jgi:uncharacterized membrane protein YgdD (TMEM256/DUF423 family)
MNSFLEENKKKTIFRLVIFGVIFFSGSIYLLATKSISGVNIKSIGIITPIGGTLLIVAWGLLIWNILKKKDNILRKK